MNATEKRQRIQEVELNSFEEIKKKICSLSIDIKQEITKCSNSNQTDTTKPSSLFCDKNEYISHDKSFSFQNDSDLSLEEILSESYEEDLSHLSHISENGGSNYEQDSIELIFENQKNYNPEDFEQENSINLNNLLKFTEKSIVEPNKYIDDSVKNEFNKKKQSINIQQTNSKEQKSKFTILTVSQTKSIQYNEKKAQLLNSKEQLKKEKFEQQQQVYEKQNIMLQNSNLRFEKIQKELEKQADILLRKQSYKHDKDNIVRAFRDTEKQIEISAERFAKDYRNRTRSTLPEPNLRAIYKLLLLPEDAVKMYVESQDEKILIQEYRHYSKLIHPDKNSHPKASIAFMKLKKFWIDIKKID